MIINNTISVSHENWSKHIEHFISTNFLRILKMDPLVQLAWKNIYNLLIFTLPYLVVLIMWQLLSIEMVVFLLLVGTQ